MCHFIFTQARLIRRLQDKCDVLEEVEVATELFELYLRIYIYIENKMCHL